MALPLDANKKRDGQPVLAGLPDGSITPQVLLDSLGKELESAQNSLTPDPALQQHSDAIRSGTSGQKARLIRPGSYQEFLELARALNPVAPDAELRAYYERTYGSSGSP